MRSEIWQRILTLHVEDSACPGFYLVIRTFTARFTGKVNALGVRRLAHIIAKTPVPGYQSASTVIAVTDWSENYLSNKIRGLQDS